MIASFPWATTARRRRRRRRRPPCTPRRRPTQALRLRMQPAALPEFPRRTTLPTPPSTSARSTACVRFVTRASPSATASPTSTPARATCDNRTRDSAASLGNRRTKRLVPICLRSPRGALRTTRVKWCILRAAATSPIAPLSPGNCCTRGKRALITRAASMESMYEQHKENADSAINAVQLSAHKDHARS